MAVSFLPNIEQEIEARAVAKLASIKESLSNSKLGRLLSLEETEQRLGQTHLGARALELYYYKLPLLKGGPPVKQELQAIPFSRYRLFKSVDEVGGQRYAQVAGTGNHLYIPYNINIRQFWDLNEPLIITEGELKALCATNYGYCCVGVPGVSIILQSATGMLLEGLTRIPMGKRVFLVYDTEVKKYLPGGGLDPACAWSQVRRDQLRLAAALTLRGCEVHIVSLPASGKMQLDEYLKEHGTIDPLLEVSRPVEFSIKPPGGMNWLQSRFAVMEGAVIDLSSSQAVRALASTMKFASFKIQYGHIKDEDKILAAALPGSKYSCRLTGVCFRPELPYRVTESGELNLWGGWAVRPRPGDVGPWLEQLRLMFQEQPELLQEYLTTIAWCFQYPGRKQHRYMMAKGSAEGTGKSWLLELPVKLMNGVDQNGQPLPHGHGLQDNAGKCLESKHNAILADKLYVVSNELSSDNKKDLAHYVKSVVTDSTLRIERKYFDAIMVPNVFLFGFTTNEIRVLDINSDTRRCLALPGWGVGSLMAQSMAAHWQSEAGRAYFAWEKTHLPEILHYLLTYDLGTYDGRQPPLKSMYFNAAVEDNYSDVDAYFYEYMADAPALVLDWEYQRFIQINPTTRVGRAWFKTLVSNTHGLVRPGCDKTKGQITGSPAVRGGTRIAVKVPVRAVNWAKEDLWAALVERYGDTKL